MKKKLSYMHVLFKCMFRDILGYRKTSNTDYFQILTKFSVFRIESQKCLISIATTLF